MSFDPAVFSQVSVVDTCAVWNMLSSRLLYQAAIQSKRYFCLTPMVLYECLQNPRSNITPEQKQLMERLEDALEEGQFQRQECSLEDLLAISDKSPGKLGAGELSCLAIAYRIRTISMLTDEKLARDYASKTLKLEVGTTPRLYGYLHFHYHLSESDHGLVIEEHERFERRPLTKFLNEAFETALRCKLMTSQNPSR